MIPSVTRVFRRDRDLHVLLQAYPRRAVPGHAASVVAFVTLYRGESKVFETTPLLAAAPPAAEAIPIRFSIPLNRLEPGSYDCQMTVLDPDGGNAAFWRTWIVLAQ
jgi:hypothetical protein